jgi:hypothetical protein
MLTGKKQLLQSLETILEGRSLPNSKPICMDVEYDMANTSP